MMERGGKLALVWEGWVPVESWAAVYLVVFAVSGGYELAFTSGIDVKPTLRGERASSLEVLLRSVSGDWVAGPAGGPVLYYNRIK